MVLFLCFVLVIPTQNGDNLVSQILMKDLLHLMTTSETELIQGNRNAIQTPEFKLETIHQVYA